MGATSLVKVGPAKTAELMMNANARIRISTLLG
jgi:hypothetical protein